jgi:hypothetical protein
MGHVTWRESELWAYVRAIVLPQIAVPNTLGQIPPSGLKIERSAVQLTGNLTLSEMYAGWLAQFVYLPQCDWYGDDVEPRGYPKGEREAGAFPESP